MTHGQQPDAGPTFTPDSLLAFRVNGADVSVPDVGDTLLGTLRDHLGFTGPKDGCSPQGQCGCCTVLVDGQPRVACVTPVRRVTGRSITTIEGLEPDRAEAWSQALCATGGSQCGFCTPGIIVRLEALAQKTSERHGTDGSQEHEESDVVGAHAEVHQALLAHLCRCTGWQTITEAWDLVRRPDVFSETLVRLERRDLSAASRRAEIEGGSPQTVSPEVSLGNGGFAADTVPEGALVAVADGNGGWALAETLTEARRHAGKTQGRRTTVGHGWPLEVPAGSWDAELRTTWVEPGYLETDASWCTPGGEPATPLANGGAFGAKVDSPLPAAARALADEHGRPVLVLASREDTVTWGSKRPPVAGGAMADGTGLLRVVATPGIDAAIAAVAPGLTVEHVPVVGPSTSRHLRAAGWAEAVALLAGARGRTDSVTSPGGATATVELVLGDQADSPPAIQAITVSVQCGRPLDQIVLRSYCIGAAHMAYSWVTNEALTVDDEGTVHDLTVRSFGITRAIDMPPVEVEIIDSDDPPVNGSDAVFAAVAAAVWLHHSCPPAWPIG